MYYLYDDANGSLRTATDASGTQLCWADYYPFGEPVAGTGCSVDNYQFAGLYADAAGEDGNYSAAHRRYNYSYYRWLSPDPGGRKVVKLDNPQTWNMYAYALNNPATLSDPGGLDVWLKGCGAESKTCHEDYLGSWNKNKKIFTRTHLKGDLTGSATLGTTGLSVSYQGRTYAGIWDTNKGENSAVFAAGAGALSGYTATVNGNCGGNCLESGFLNNTNSLAGYFAVRNSLSAAGSGFLRNPGFDPIDIFHLGSTNFRGYDPTQPEGLSSTHVPVPNKLRFDPYGNPINVPFHVDQRYPYEDVLGFGEHAGSVMGTIWNDMNALLGP